MQAAPLAGSGRAGAGWTRCVPRPGSSRRSPRSSCSLGGLVAGPTAPAARAAGALPTWDGSVDLYRDGAFTTQASWLWCTAAGVQIARNLVFDEDDHRASSQERYFDWMRRHNRYDLPESAGVDPVGWAAGMREFVDDRYRLVSHDTFVEALRLAVTRIRLTGLPVALTVAHGGHGWLLTGFSATADPAVDDGFRIRSVRVTGPLFGRQSRDGYDMPPDTSLTPAELERFFTPWRYDPLPMIWDGTLRVHPAHPAGGGADAGADRAPRRRPRRPAQVSPAPDGQRPAPTPFAAPEIVVEPDASGGRPPRPPVRATSRPRHPRAVRGWPSSWVSGSSCWSRLVAARSRRGRPRG